MVLLSVFMVEVVLVDLVDLVNKMDSCSRKSLSVASKFKLDLSL